MPLKQEVNLVVEDEKGEEVFKSNGLRVDFDVRFIDQFSRATFEIYNLNDAAIKRILTGERYVTVTTKTHGRNEFVVARKYFLSNGYDEVVLPNTITKLFCFDKLEKEVMEFETGGVTIEAPCSLERMVSGILRTAGYFVAPKYLFFPEGATSVSSSRRKASFEGSVGDCLAELAEEYEFSTYIIDGIVTLIYRPDSDNVDKTDLPKADPIYLQTDMMRSNPIIGPAMLNITSNLDSRLTPGKVLDISRLLTAGANFGEQSSQLASGFFAEGLTAFSRYQIIAVQHKGSNYTEDWFSNITASSPTKGEVAPTFNWFQA